MGPQAMLRTVEQLLTFDGFPHVRVQAAFVISYWAQQSPGLREILRRRLELERSDDVREALRGFVDRGSGLVENPDGPPDLSNAPVHITEGTIAGVSMP